LLRLPGLPLLNLRGQLTNRRLPRRRNMRSPMKHSNQTKKIMMLNVRKRSG
jgi:hypothetical protein